MEQRLIHLLARSLSPNDTDDSYDSIAGGIAQSVVAWRGVAWLRVYDTLSKATTYRMGEQNLA